MLKVKKILRRRKEKTLKKKKENAQRKISNCIKYKELPCERSNTYKKCRKYKRGNKVKKKKKKKEQFL